MKKIKKLLFISILSVCLMGCMKLNMNIRIDETGKLTYDMDMLVSESLLEMSGASIEDLKSSMEEESSMQGAKFKEIEKTIDDEKWVGYNIKPDDELVEFQAATVKDGKVTLEVPRDVLSSFSGEMEATEEEMQEMESMGAEVNMNFIMPGKVKSTTVGEIVDDNTVKINLLKTTATEEVVIVSEIESDSNMLMIGIVVVGIAILAVIGFVYFKKSKTKKNEIETQEITNEDTVTEETPIEAVEEVVETTETIVEDSVETTKEEADSETTAE